MGIPKFFRYISERYPLISQLIEENKVSEFDNLYIDFNGIIHQCSHTDDGEIHFNHPEEQIFTSIFSYLDHLFWNIKPKKLLFIAVDGVAPRAKMNQQRNRRFRAAKETREARERAERKGVKVFDSNCITPGTVFMARLAEQLKYFVNKKISEDSNWRECKVILSGHDVPGEGEHKIVEYIRKSRAQPGYDPNTRHCLYGLDADLIMLGLLTHDPHFCLLRERVNFGPAGRGPNTRPELTHFYLLHLSLMREYLDLEFQEIGPALSFEYNLERIIDDFVLLAVFVGNDFLPNLPEVHIRESGLEYLFEVYKHVLPSLDGYLNESGTINTAHLQVLLDKMRDLEEGVFHHKYEYDPNWVKEKESGRSKPVGASGSATLMTSSQRTIFNKVRAFALENLSVPSSGKVDTKLSMPRTSQAGERAFLTNLVRDSHLSLSWDKEDQNLAVLRFRGVHSGEKDNESNSQGEVEDMTAAVDPASRNYHEAIMMPETIENRSHSKRQQKKDDWKRTYYVHKLGISYDDREQMKTLISSYIEGLQWVMHYYYSGVCSWGWFYRYRYAPRISDFMGVDKMTFHFKLGKPFLPFQQLMGVLPEASKHLVPPPYRPLMSDVDSPIIDFYPRKFQLDMDGKKREWEAVINIPFIDENRLLDAMQLKESKLTEEERRRNTFGTPLSFAFRPGPPTVYPSPLPGIFPALHRSQCSMETYNLPTLDGLHPSQGLCDGVLLGPQSLAGFPSLKTINHRAKLGNHGIDIHGSESRDKSITIHIENSYEHKKHQEVAEEMIGKRVFIGWPFLREGKVTAVSDPSSKYEGTDTTRGASANIVQNPHSPLAAAEWKSKSEAIEGYYSKQCGVVTGPVNILVHVLPLRGMKTLDTGALVKEYETRDNETEHAIQMVITSVASEDPRYVEKASVSLQEEFPIGTMIFFLGKQAYGTYTQVSGVTDTGLSLVFTYSAPDNGENERFKALVRNRLNERYYPFLEVAKIVGIPSKAVSRLTSKVMAVDGDRSGKVNVGLGVKFEAKAQKVIGYSRKTDRHWEFSQTTVELLKEYKAKFPEVVIHLAEKSGNDFIQLSEVFSGPDCDSRSKELKAWLRGKGIRDFEAVPLSCDSVEKETVRKIEHLVDQLPKGRKQKARVDGVPRQAVLKSEHGRHRLQHQRFALGDRVIMVKDSGSVPLSMKGVVIGVKVKVLDVVWDGLFVSGSTLGNRCSPRRGATVEFHSCLNLSDPQVIASHPLELQQLYIRQSPPPHSAWKSVNSRSAFRS